MAACATHARHTGDAPIERHSTRRVGRGGRAGCRSLRSGEARPRRVPDGAETQAEAHAAPRPRREAPARPGHGRGPERRATWSAGAEAGTWALRGREQTRASPLRRGAGRVARGIVRSLERSPRPLRERSERGEERGMRRADRRGRHGRRGASERGPPWGRREALGVLDGGHAAGLGCGAGNRRRGVGDSGNVSGREVSRLASSRSEEEAGGWGLRQT